MMVGYMGGVEAGCTSLPSVYVTLSKLPPPEKNCAWMRAVVLTGVMSLVGCLSVGGVEVQLLSKLECTYLRWSDWRVTWCTAIFFLYDLKCTCVFLPDVGR